jgi:NAD(P)-dependent dehydrogenase (short-subunit alcohol dehydrogenase family)
MPIDVTDDASVAQAAADVKAHEGRVDRVINNAGIVGSHAKAEDLVGDDAALEERLDCPGQAPLSVRQN